MKCSYCGSEPKEGYKYCPGCGSNVIEKKIESYFVDGGRLPPKCERRVDFGRTSHVDMVKQTTEEVMNNLSTAGVYAERSLVEGMVREAISCQ